MYFILGSEIARLIYGFMLEHGHTQTADTMLQELPELHEIRILKQKGLDSASPYMGIFKLSDILDDYCHSCKIIQDAIDEYPSFYLNIDKFESLSSKVKKIFSSSIGRVAKKSLKTIESYRKRIRNEPSQTSSAVLSVKTFDNEDIPGYIPQEVNPVCTDSNAPPSTPPSSPPPPEMSTQKRKGSVKKTPQQDPSPSNPLDNLIKNLLEDKVLHERIAGISNREVHRKISHSTEGIETLDPSEHLHDTAGYLFYDTTSKNMFESTLDDIEKLLVRPHPEKAAQPPDIHCRRNLSTPPPCIQDESLSLVSPAQVPLSIPPNDGSACVSTVAEVLGNSFIEMDSQCSASSSLLHNEQHQFSSIHNKNDESVALDNIHNSPKSVALSTENNSQILQTSFCQSPKTSSPHKDQNIKLMESTLGNSVSTPFKNLQTGSNIFSIVPQCDKVSQISKDSSLNENDSSLDGSSNTQPQEFEPEPATCGNSSPTPGQISIGDNAKNASALPESESPSKKKVEQTSGVPSTISEGSKSVDSETTNASDTPSSQEGHDDNNASSHETGDDQESLNSDTSCESNEDSEKHTSPNSSINASSVAVPRLSAIKNKPDLYIFNSPLKIQIEEMPKSDSVNESTDITKNTQEEGLKNMDLTNQVLTSILDSTVVSVSESTQSSDIPDGLLNESPGSDSDDSDSESLPIEIEAILTVAVENMVLFSKERTYTKEDLLRALKDIYKSKEKRKPLTRISRRNNIPLSTLRAHYKRLKMKIEVIENERSKVKKKSSPEKKEIMKTSRNDSSPSKNSKTDQLESKNLNETKDPQQMSVKKSDKKVKKFSKKEPKGNKKLKKLNENKIMKDLHKTSKKSNYRATKAHSLSDCGNSDDDQPMNTDEENSPIDETCLDDSSVDDKDNSKSNGINIDKEEQASEMISKESLSVERHPDENHNHSSKDKENLFPKNVLKPSHDELSGQLKSLCNDSKLFVQERRFSRRRSSSVHMSPALQPFVKKKSLSTPRRQLNHVRALDFSTPNKERPVTASKKAISHLKFDSPKAFGNKSKEKGGSLPDTLDSIKPKNIACNGMPKIMEEFDENRPLDHQDKSDKNTSELNLVPLVTTMPLIGSDIPSEVESESSRTSGFLELDLALSDDGSAYSTPNKIIASKETPISADEKATSKNEACERMLHDEPAISEEYYASPPNVTASSTYTPATKSSFLKYPSGPYSDSSDECSPASLDPDEGLLLGDKCENISDQSNKKPINERVSKDLDNPVVHSHDNSDEPSSKKSKTSAPEISSDLSDKSSNIPLKSNKTQIEGINCNQGSNHKEAVSSNSKGITNEVVSPSPNKKQEEKSNHSLSPATKNLLNNSRSESPDTIVEDVQKIFARVPPFSFWGKKEAASKDVHIESKEGTSPSTEDGQDADASKEKSFVASSSQCEKLLNESNSGSILRITSTRPPPVKVVLRNVSQASTKGCARLIDYSSCPVKPSNAYAPMESIFPEKSSNEPTQQLENEASNIEPTESPSKSQSHIQFESIESALAALDGEPSDNYESFNEESNGHNLSLSVIFDVEKPVECISSKFIRLPVGTPEKEVESICQKLVKDKVGLVAFPSSLCSESSSLQRNATSLEDQLTHSTKQNEESQSSEPLGGYSSEEEISIKLSQSKTFDIFSLNLSDNDDYEAIIAEADISFNSCNESPRNKTPKHKSRKEAKRKSHSPHASHKHSANKSHKRKRIHSGEESRKKSKTATTKIEGCTGFRQNSKLSRRKFQDQREFFNVNEESACSIPPTPGKDTTFLM